MRVGHSSSWVLIDGLQLTLHSQLIGKGWPWSALVHLLISLTKVNQANSKKDKAWKKLKIFSHHQRETGFLFVK